MPDIYFYLKKVVFPYGRLHVLIEPLISLGLDPVDCSFSNYWTQIIIDRVDYVTPYSRVSFMEVRLVGINYLIDRVFTEINFQSMLWLPLYELLSLLWIVWGLALCSVGYSNFMSNSMKLNFCICKIHW